MEKTQLLVVEIYERKTGNKIKERIALRVDATEGSIAIFTSNNAYRYSTKDYSAKIKSYKKD